MKAPIDWLKDYVDINVSTKELADAMTMSGSKVEGIEVQGEEITKVVVGKILSLEKHPDADRLQVAKVDVGSEVLQIVTGAQNVNVGDYIPVALVGSHSSRRKENIQRKTQRCGILRHDVLNRKNWALPGMIVPMRRKTGFISCPKKRNWVKILKKYWD